MEHGVDTVWIDWYASTSVWFWRCQGLAEGDERDVLGGGGNLILLAFSSALAFCG